MGTPSGMDPDWAAELERLDRLAQTRAGSGPVGSAAAPARSPTRPRPPLPPGMFDGSVAADRHVVTSAATALLVDGYNLGRMLWPGLPPEEERRRVVALLEDLEARSRGHVVVVFDGDSTQRGPASSRRVRVVFSETGVTADDELVALLAALPGHRPAVVVTSDRAVATRVRGLGAVVMSSPRFAAAAGR